MSSEKLFFRARPSCNLAYIVEGESDKTMLFLHGMGSSKEAWAKNISAFKDEYTCIALDLPGYGDSDPLDETYSIPIVASMVVEFIRSRNLREVILVGHSMGGQLSIEVTSMVPDLIAGLCLVAPAGLEVFTQAEVDLIAQYFTAELISSYPRVMIKKNFELNFYEMPDDAIFMIEDRYNLKEDKPRYLRFCQTFAESTLAIVGYNVVDKLKKIEQPVLLCFGQDDKIIPHHILHPDKKIEDIAQNAIAQLANGKLKIFENCGHFIQWEKAAEVNALIKDFVK